MSQSHPCHVIPCIYFYIAEGSGFENVKIYHVMLVMVSWTEHVTNEEVLTRAGTKRELMMTIRQRQLRFLGHVMRKNELENVVLTGKIEGTRNRGRKRLTTSVA